MWERIVLIAIGGALGALSRYGLEGVVDGWRGPTVLGTFVVNISGALALGLLVGFTEDRVAFPALARTAIAIGFLGAYTTFSTLMFETVELAEGGSWATAALNAAGSVAAGLAALYAGLVLGRSV
ncbi:MAG: CrcB family protein [Chloroflexi bacterium]|nr:CrcB family protein [Chloroflexota bacterium]